MAKRWPSCLHGESEEGGWEIKRKKKMEWTNRRREKPKMTEDDEDETQRREKPKMTEDTEEDETPGEETR